MHYVWCCASRAKTIFCFSKNIADKPQFSELSTVQARCIMMRTTMGSEVVVVLPASKHSLWMVVWPLFSFLPVILITSGLIYFSSCWCFFLCQQEQCLSYITPSFVYIYFFFNPREFALFIYKGDKSDMLCIMLSNGIQDLIQQ